MDGDAILDLLKTNLAEAMPERVVTREHVDFAQRSKDDMDSGVITIIAVNVTGLDSSVSFADATGKLRAILMFEFRLKEKSTRLDVERAEWAFIKELFDFMQAPGLGLCPFNVSDAQLSGQTAAPFGWVLMNIEYSELDTQG